MVIHFYQDADVPIFTLTAHAESKRADLSQIDRNDLPLAPSVMYEDCTLQYALSMLILDRQVRNIHI
jgi:hypothetical protein